MPIVEERELHVERVAADAASDTVRAGHRLDGQRGVGERLDRCAERDDRAAPSEVGARDRRRRAGRRARAEQRGQERLEHRLAHGGGEKHEHEVAGARALLTRWRRALSSARRELCTRRNAAF